MKHVWDTIHYNAAEETTQEEKPCVCDGIKPSTHRVFIRMHRSLNSTCILVQTTHLPSFMYLHLQLLQCYRANDILPTQRNRHLHHFLVCWRMGTHTDRQDTLKTIPAFPSRLVKHKETNYKERTTAPELRSLLAKNVRRALHKMVSADRVNKHIRDLLYLC